MCWYADQVLWWYRVMIMLVVGVILLTWIRFQRWSTLLIDKKLSQVVLRALCSTDSSIDLLSCDQQSQSTNSNKWPVLSHHQTSEAIGLFTFAFRCQCPNVITVITTTYCNIELTLLYYTLWSLFSCVISYWSSYCWPGISNWKLDHVIVISSCWSAWDSTDPIVKGQTQWQHKYCG